MDNMNNSGYKIGFCCKWLSDNNSLSIKEKETVQRPMNQPQTTLLSLRKLGNAAGNRIEELVRINCETLWRQLKWVAEQPTPLRLFRITSAMIPADGVPEFKDIVESSTVQSILQEGLKGIREFSDKNMIRLCMHPGQYSNLSSTTPQTVENAILDIERHTDLAVKMGYGNTWHSSGFAINIHANIRQDPYLLQMQYIINNRMTQEARNLITVENDEVGCGLEQMLDTGLPGIVPIVLDIHHHWIRSRGEYINADDLRIEAIKDSWKEVRPLTHFSTSDETEILLGHSKYVKPDFAQLIEHISAQKLRKHSVLPWNHAVNRWAIQHLAWSDMEVESKGKNLASQSLLDFIEQNSSTSLV